jgi:hypothetical protein
VALSGVTPGDEDAVKAQTQRLEDKQRVNPARAGHLYYPYVGGILLAAGSGEVSAGIAAPLAEKANQPWFPISLLLHKAEPFYHSGGLRDNLAVAILALAA